MSGIQAQRGTQQSANAKYKVKPIKLNIDFGGRAVAAALYISALHTKILRMYVRDLSIWTSNSGISTAACQTICPLGFTLGHECC